MERWEGWRGGEVERLMDRWGENLDRMLQHSRFGLGGKCVVCGGCCERWS